LPADYFLLTFTLPAQLRSLAWTHQRVIYDLMTRCAWDTVNTVSRNDRQLQGTPGATTVLHTHPQRLDYHPHIHLVLPGAAINPKKRLWRKSDHLSGPLSLSGCHSGEGYPGL
jgi:hypothetical protein